MDFSADGTGKVTSRFMREIVDSARFEFTQRRDCGRSLAYWTFRL